MVSQCRPDPAGRSIRLLICCELALLAYQLFIYMSRLRWFDREWVRWRITDRLVICKLVCNCNK